MPPQNKTTTKHFSSLQGKFLELYEVQGRPATNEYHEISLPYTIRT